MTLNVLVESLKIKVSTKRHFKKFLLWLGNIGLDYALTRHNLGFDVLNYIAKEGTKIY